MSAETSRPSDGTDPTRPDDDPVNAYCAEVHPRLEQLASWQMGQKPARWEEPGDIAQKVIFEQLDHIREALDQGQGMDEVERRLTARIRWRVLDVIHRNKRLNGWSAVPPGCQDQAAHPSETLNRRETAATLEQALARLPDEDARIVRLVALEHLSHKQVAKLLKMKENTVGRRYLRAIEKLSVWLEPRQDP